MIQLCPSATILISASIQFSADNQEISTQGYPTGSTRATIKIAPGNNVATLIKGRNSGIRIKNIQLDGDRPNNGLGSDGGANIEIGGGSTDQVVTRVASRNPRGWSCLHVIGSGDDASPCKNATISNNDIGPCGQEGTDSKGQALWSDGISLDCTNSLVSSNTITGPTDGGIVIFGSPGSTITGNTIQSSATERGFGAINMVDEQYHGSYANVVVSNNKIIGQKLFNLGIGIGSSIWSDYNPSPLHGPATIKDNVFSGNIVFAIAINGWDNGITVAGNDVSNVNKPNSNFADDVGCSYAVQTIFNQASSLVYYTAGISGTKNLQSDFVAAASNVNDFLCTSPPLPSSLTFSPNGLISPADSGPFAKLHGGIIMQYQGDGNTVVLDYSGPNGGVVKWASGHAIPNGGSCSSPNTCDLVFQGDGNLVSYYNGSPLWASGTNPQGQSMVCLNHAPWIQILNANGSVIWTTTDLT